MPGNSRENMPADIPPQNDPPSVAFCLAALAADADDLNASLAGGTLSATPWTDALHQLAQLRATLTTLRALESSYVSHIYLHGEHGKRVLDGLGQVTISRGRERKAWEHRAVAVDYVDAHVARTGEVPDPHQVVDWVLEAVAPSYWRVTQLREAGLDPEDYCVSEPGKPTVSIDTPL